MTTENKYKNSNNKYEGSPGGNRSTIVGGGYASMTMGIQPPNPALSTSREIVWYRVVLGWRLKRQL